MRVHRSAAAVAALAVQLASAAAKLAVAGSSSGGARRGAGPPPAVPVPAAWDVPPPPDVPEWLLAPSPSPAIPLAPSPAFVRALAPLPAGGAPAPAGSSVPWAGSAPAAATPRASLGLGSSPAPAAEESADRTGEPASEGGGGSPAVALPAPAPGGRPDSPPCVTSPMEVDQTVDDRIAQDSHRIGLVAQRLVDVQDGIRHVEHEVLGKVFDMSSLKAFFDQHAAAVEENKRLTQESDRLVKTVASLGEQLKQAQKQYEQQEESYKAKEVEEQDDVKQLEDKVPDMLKDLEHEKVLEQMNKEAEEANGRLREQIEKEKKVLEALAEELAVAEADVWRRRNVTKELKGALFEQQKYAEDCERGVQQLSMKLADVAKARVADRNYVAAAEQSSLQTYRHLKLRNHLFKVRLQKARANEATIQSQVLVAKDKFAALQMHGEAELGRMRDELGGLHEKAEALDSELTSIVTERHAVEKETRNLTAQLRQLEKTLLAGELEVLEANNTKMKKFLSATQVALQRSQMKLAESHAEVVKVNMTLIALRKAAEQNSAEAEQVARDALAKVAATKGKGDQSAAAADDAVMKAESAQSSDCASLWDARNPDILKELESCTSVAQDLQTSKAEVSALTSMVSMR